MAAASMGSVGVRQADMTRADRYVNAGNNATRMAVVHPEVDTPVNRVNLIMVVSDIPAEDTYPKNITGMTMSARLFQCVAIYDLGSSVSVWTPSIMRSLGSIAS
jgi:hypothetical protein